MTEAIVSAPCPAFPSIDKALEWLTDCARQVMHHSGRHSPMFFFCYYDRPGVMADFKTDDKLFITQIIKEMVAVADPPIDFGVFIDEAWMVRKAQDDPVGIVAGKLEDDPRRMEILLITVYKNGEPDEMKYYSIIRDAQGKFIELMFYKEETSNRKTSIGRFVRLLG